jgi:hypothetical protein
MNDEDYLFPFLVAALVVLLLLPFGRFRLHSLLVALRLTLVVLLSP